MSSSYDTLRSVVVVCYCSVGLAAAAALVSSAAAADAACETRATSAEAVMTESCEHLSNLSFCCPTRRAGDGSEPSRAEAVRHSALALGPQCGRQWATVSQSGRRRHSGPIVGALRWTECNCSRLTSDQSEC